jgi:recombination protein RecA
VVEGEMGDSKMGLHARLMSQALRKLTGTISKTNCTVFFINQLREKLGDVWKSRDYDWWKCTEILRFGTFRHSSFHQIKDGDNVLGNRTKVKCKKQSSTLLKLLNLTSCMVKVFQNRRDLRSSC